MTILKLEKPKMKKISWGILSTAKIGVGKVIPAMQKGNFTEITAIASRNIERAQDTANRLNIPRAYGSYEELLDDKDIEAVYIPLPNQLHVPWTIKSLRAGKHVLCEKPIGLTFQEADYLYHEAVKYPGLKVMEAFMYRHHPQWKRAKQLVEECAIGALKTIQSFFSYYNVNPGDIRNRSDMGGGALLDIGCYCISLSRFLFNSEPKRLVGMIAFDPGFTIDRLTSAMMEFEAGSASFTCATQLQGHQRVNIFGTSGRIEIEIPFNAPPDKPCKIFLQSGAEIKEIVFDICDQYTIQGDLFSEAILNNAPVPTPLDDAVANMRIIDKIFASAKTGSWLNLT
jgi:predicted dehydrogenase